MNNTEKAEELGLKFFPDEENIWARNNVEAIRCTSACLEMAQWKDEQLKQTRKDAGVLYDEISDCIDRLVKSRLSKNGIGESNALQQMESIMVQTQQFLQII